MVIRWVTRALDRTIGVMDASTLIVASAEQLNVTPWVLDHAVWNAERN